MESGNKKHVLRWLMHANQSERFPFRLYIEENPGEFLVFNVQARWPGPNRKIYCLKDNPCKEIDLPREDPIEQCMIKNIYWYGKKLNVLLDRKTKKRCWFLFLKKEYKNKPGEIYDQIFWITQSSVMSRRPGAYIPKVRQPRACEVIIDTRERYPYKFGYAQVERKNLPAGDYGLVKEGRLVAVAERKTLDNFKHEISTYDVFKAALRELASYPHKAIVFESPYSDFLDPKKIKPYSANYVAEIIADLAVLFPEIQFVFCSNRKFAQEWVYRWFLRINIDAESH